MHKVLVKNEEFIWRNLEGELVLLNPVSGQYFGLNSVGCSFYEKIDGQKTVEEIITSLLDKFEVERHILEQDLGELIDVMVEKKTLFIK